MSQEVVTPRDEALAELGQDQLASAPVEEFRAEFLFEARDALGQRRLRQVERVSRSLNGRMRRDREQVSNVAEIDHHQTLPKVIKI